MPKIFAISDLHLSFGVNKPMHVFGARWENYEARLRENWQSIVSSEDIVLMPGDTSWATYLKDGTEDFSFIHSLNGIKLISKGNHDYWWETLSKLNGFLEENAFSSIRFIHNTNFVVGDTVICGTKGYPETEKEPEGEEEKKLYNRELIRLENAILEAKKTGASRIVVMLHYPPGPNTAFARCMQEHQVNACVFGHLHGVYDSAVQGNVRGVEYRLVSCDYLKFKPLKLMEVKMP